MFPRFKLWVTLWVSSIVVCLSFLSYRRDLNELATPSWTLQDRLVFFVSSISVFLSFLGIILTIFHGRERRTFGNPESVLVWSVCILWSIGSIVAIIDGSDTSGDGITDENDQALLLLNPSILTFSFVCVVTSVIIISSWFKQYVVSNDSPSVTYFMLLAAMSFIAMVSSISFRNVWIKAPVVSGLNNNSTSTDDFTIIQNETLSALQNETTMTGMTTTTTTENEVRVIRQCEIDGNDCARINFAIWLSAISGACCCIMTAWNGISVRCKVDACMTLFAAWFVAAFLLTTMTAPNFSVVSLYFSVWICLFLSLHLLIVLSTYDNTHNEGKSRTSQVVGRMDILNVAYDAMDSAKKQRPTRSDSYEDLFEQNDDWDSMVGSVLPTENAMGQETLFTQSIRDQQRNKRLFEATCVNRLELWSNLLMVSTVCLTSFHFYQGDQKQPKSIYNKLGIAVPSISIAFSIIGIGTVLRTSKVSKIIEPSMVRMLFRNITQSLSLALPSSFLCDSSTYYSF